MNNNVISMVRKQINGTDIYKEDWENIKGTNCYSYALCNDLSAYELKKLDESFDYFVGIFSDSAEYIDDYKDLEEAFYKDMNVLNIDIIKANANCKLTDNEWLIAMYMTEKYYDEKLEKIDFDFHFLRKSKDGIWRHKMGNLGRICEIDDDYETIYDPNKANMYLDDNLKYNLVGIYKLHRK